LHELGITGSGEGGTDWINVVSSNVTAIRYVPGDPYPVQIMFHGNAVYGYAPPGDGKSEFEAILTAPSKGSAVYYVLKMTGVPYLRFS
jgi:hypothetical protein